MRNGPEKDKRVETTQDLGEGETSGGRPESFEDVYYSGRQIGVVGDGLTLK